MKLRSEFALATRLLWRDWRAGELALIAVAIVVAVASVTTVGFFTDRVHQALGRQANQLLGADLVIGSGKPLQPQFEREARERGLTVVRAARFPSMAVRGERSALTSVKVVSAGFPLRGELRTAKALFGPDARAAGIPAPGTAWADERLVNQLGLALGDKLELGQAAFTVAAIVTHEPEAAIGFISSAPRLLMNEADLESTGLIQPGSRISYRLMAAGTAEAIESYRTWAQRELEPGQRIEGIRDARPEIRAALERAEKFLSLAALVAAVLAAVAIGLATRRFLQRHLDACAMMRCLGANESMLLRLYLMHFVLLGLAASALGCLIGVGAQAALAQWLGTLVDVELPGPGGRPALHGMLTGLAVLLGFALPPLVALGRVPTLRVLRRELGVPPVTGIATYGLGYAAVAGMILWKAEGLRLGAMVLGGFTVAVGAAALLTWLALKAVGRMRMDALAWRYGVANLRRRALGSVIQVVALAIGIMALLVLTVVRNDLIHAWRTSLPPDAPNRFLVNIQPDQVAPLRAYFARHAVRSPTLYPMVRARLTRINERPVSAADYADERARRLINREFNLSWAERMQTDNQLADGRWWSGTAPQPQFSVETGISETLGMQLGDMLTFDIAGAPVTARITSLRKVDWDSFNVNFFVLAPPGMLERHPATYVTSFYLPPNDAALLTGLVQQFPNLLVIDVAQVLAQVQKMMDQVSRAVQFIFVFTVLAGLVVLYAALASTRDERIYQATLMRTLGASRRQLKQALVAEYAALGTLAGLLAASGAAALGYVVATRVLNLPYAFSASVWLVGALAGAIGIAAAGYAGARRVVEVAPLKVLRELG
ncbi:MAG TPA: FtsX-like permease family protein [Burkholderiales bacterium]|nr:FtsX-like permease family protein [Burkholderiales bacterium]